METAVQFSIFLVNKPGVLAQVTGKLAEEKVNVVALTMMDSMEHGVLRLVTQHTDRARKALRRPTFCWYPSPIAPGPLPTSAADWLTPTLTSIMPIPLPGLRAGELRPF